MKRRKKAIGYVNEVRIPGDGKVIDAAAQKAAIEAYARKENLELIDVIEETEAHEDLMDRPGVISILVRHERVDFVLVERIWSLARKKSALEPLLDEFDKMGARLTATTYLWDMASQQVRHRYHEELAVRARRAVEEKARAQALSEVA